MTMGEERRGPGSPSRTPSFTLLKPSSNSTPAARDGRAGKRSANRRSGNDTPRSGQRMARSSSMVSRMVWGSSPISASSWLPIGASEWKSGRNMGLVSCPECQPGIGSGDHLSPTLPGLARRTLFSNSMRRRRPAASRSQTDRGDIEPRLSTGMPWASAMRMPRPVPPETSPPAVQQTAASTGRSRVSESRIDTFLAWSFRTVGEHRSHAGCRVAATSMHADNADGDSTRQSGPQRPL